MSETAQVRNSRVFMQLETTLLPYDLIQCSGLSDWNRPRGAVTPFREQSLSKIGAEDVVGYSRASPDMAAFTIQSRLRETGNFMFALNCEVNVQALIKDCGDPMDYYGFQYGLAWVNCPPGDMTGEAIKVIEGDNVPVGLANPFNAIWGPYLVDFKVRFLSVRDIAETGTIYDMYFFPEECQEDCLFRATNGQYGYAAAGAQAGSPIDVANMWFTEDTADSWTVTSENPFAAGEDVGSVVVVGTVQNHRIIVAREETDAGNPAEIAYADVTAIGQTAWVNVDVGAVNGQYITGLSWPNFRNLFAITNDGYIYRSRDGGVTWVLIYVQATAISLNDISSLKRGQVWIVGDEDLVLFSDDFGDSITTIDGPADNPGADYHTVHVCPDRKVFVGGSVGGVDGMLYGSMDEGDEWSLLPQQGVDNIDVVRVRGFDTHWLWSVVTIGVDDSRVLRSTDGGATWRVWRLAQNINPNNGIFALSVIDVNRVVVAGAPYPWIGGTAFLTRTETNLDRIV